MWRSFYDQSCATWSPQGRIFQIDYATEAVKQGSVSIGLRSNTHAIVIGLKRSPHEMAGYQEKVFKLDDHVGISMSGLIVDGRLIVKMLRNECLTHKAMYNSPHPISRLITKLASKSQKKTMGENKRPFGVGLLVAGYDDLGPHLYHTSPNAEYFEYYAYSIGAKSQSAKTYLEKNYKAFPNSITSNPLTKLKGSLNDLVMHGLKALKASEGEIELTSKNVSIGIVGKDEPFKMMNEPDLKEAILLLHQQQPAGAVPMEH